MKKPAADWSTAVTLSTTAIAFAGTLPVPPIARFKLPPLPSLVPVFLVSSNLAGVTAVYTLGGWNWKLSDAETALVPASVVTATSTVPAAWAGLTAVTCVSDTTVKLVAVVAPNLTAVAAVNPHPPIVTPVPPDTEPAAGLTEVTAGAPPAPRLQVANGPTLKDHVYGSEFTVSATVYVTPFWRGCCGNTITPPRQLR